MISAQAVDPLLGHRLAAFADGEGCFFISAPRRKGNYFCSFVIRLRADDEPLLRRYRDGCFGIGGLISQPRSNNWAPTVTWEVRRKEHVIFIRDLFELYPLWSKKARDFAVWSEAVDFWRYGVNGRKTDWTPMEEARDRLRSTRVFQGRTPVLSPIGERDR